MEWDLKLNKYSARVYKIVYVKMQGGRYATKQNETFEKRRTMLQDLLSNFTVIL